MKSKSFIYFFFIFYLPLHIPILSQETKDSKKALDAFINATTKSTLNNFTVPDREIRLANAEIIRATITSLNSTSKFHFDLNLLSRIVTDKDGEFKVIIPQNQFSKIADASTFELRLQIKPPKDFNGNYTSDIVNIKLEKKKGPIYELTLFWISESLKTNKGTFAVSSKAQT